MLVRTLIILAYLFATLLSPLQASVCDEMIIGTMVVNATDGAVQQSHSVSDIDSNMNHQSPCVSNMASHMSADDCNNMCATVFAPFWININGITQLVTIINLPDSTVLQNVISQVLAAHNSRQLRPPIS